MQKTRVIDEIMFGYDGMSEETLASKLDGIEPKLIRWMATHHPDNKTRRLLLSRTNVSIGEGAVSNTGIVISDNYKPLVRIGKRVAISPYVTIIAASGPNNSHLKDDPYVKKNLAKEERVKIGDDAWIGSNVVILPGVTIGKGSIIGAGSVVTGDVPAHRVAMGAPCRAMRKLSG